MINKEIVSRVIEDNYSSSYKLFSVNSYDGYHIDKPIGLFISLGIMTSMSTLKKVSESLSESFNNNEVNISEIESRLVNGKYVNKLSNKIVSEQYSSGSITEGEKINFSDIEKLIDSLKNTLLDNKDNNSMVLEYSKRLSKVSKIMGKFDENFDWENHSILIVNTKDKFSINVINEKINYIQYEENYNGNSVTVHKRIGIFIKF